MEEAIGDHGFDRLRFFLCFLAIFFPASAHATTFGPLSLANQLRNAEFILHGIVQGTSWTEMDQRINRPFTYWKLQVLDEVSSHPAGDNVDIRSPGGEINGFGYHVAGSARFSDGEEIFVIAKSSDRSHVLDIVGLASGKYVVESEADGKKIVRSALGYPVLDANGKAFEPAAFLAFAKRVKAGQESEAERNILLNKDPVHAHDAVWERPLTPDQTKKNAALNEYPSHAPLTKAVEPNQINAEEPSKGSGNWLFIVSIAVVFFVIGTAILYIKR